MKLKSVLLSAVATFALAPAAMAERGADGQLNILYWQAPSILNPYLSSGTKDVESSSLIVEPLAGFDDKGNVFARLAAPPPPRPVPQEPQRRVCRLSWMQPMPRWLRRKRI